MCSRVKAMMQGLKKMLRLPRFSRADKSTSHLPPISLQLPVSSFTTPRTPPASQFSREYLAGSSFEITMSLWREACQQLRHAVPKVAAGDRICMAQSRRYLSGSASRRGIQVAESGVASMNMGRSGQIWREMRNRGQSQRFAQPRRQFSATAGTAHGHITPPKPGEE